MFSTWSGVHASVQYLKWSVHKCSLPGVECTQVFSTWSGVHASDKYLKLSACKCLVLEVECTKMYNLSAIDYPYFILQDGQF